MIRPSYVTICTILSLACMPPAMASGKGSGYVWANEASQYKYKPNKQYAYNSAGEIIYVVRHAQGRYQVTFSGLGGHGQAGGHAQVTSYGSGDEYCKVASWDSSAKDFNVNVNCFTSNGQPADTQYAVHVDWPPPTYSQKVEVSERSPSSGIVKRSIKPNGRIELHYPDGKVKNFTLSRQSAMHANAATTQDKSTQAPAPIPPSLPDNAERAWLIAHNESLLDLIMTLVDHDQSAVQAYLAYERPSTSLYEQIARRSETIQFLVTP